MKIAKGTKEIGSLAFAQCGSLHTVYLPTTLDSISEHEYEGCTSLKDVYIYSKEMTIFSERTNYSLKWEPKAMSESQKATCAHPFKDSAQTVTIHGYPGSTAQMYAEAFGLRFEPLEEIGQ